MYIHLHIAAHVSINVVEKHAAAAAGGCHGVVSIPTQTHEHTLYKKVSLRVSFTVANLRYSAAVYGTITYR